MNDNSRPAVVIVDDEDMVLTSIRAFLSLETDYRVHCFTDPERAIDHLGAQAAEVVISDYLMPKLNGIQFLAKAKEVQPEATRVLLTGHADKQSAIQAINDVALFQYIEKPWDNAQLLLVIQSGIERAQLLRNLRDKINQLDTAHTNLKEVQSRLLRAFL